jgi:DNA-directed RNA polymerase specialized sigma24 family protein
VTSNSAKQGPRETVGSGHEWFQVFSANHQLRLRVGLVSAFGPEIGEESAADAVVYAWEHRERLAMMANPVGYLFRVGQSAARHHRRRWRGVELPSVSIALEPQVDVELPRALAKLSQRQRLAVVLVHVSGWTLEEAAVAMDIDVSSVRTHIARGLSRLRTLLREEGR